MRVRLWLVDALDRACTDGPAIWYTVEPGLDGSLWPAHAEALAAGVST